jgi:hypothetical protein
MQAVLEDQQPMQQVVGDDRLGHVELELACLGRDRDSRVVADQLEANLVDDLGDNRIDLARHYRAARLRRRQVDLVKTRPRPGRQQPQVVADLRDHDRGALERPGELDERTCRRPRKTAQ